MFDLGEGLFDWVQVRRVLGQEPQAGTGVFDHVAHGRGFVAAEIVENNDIAGVQGRDQNLLDVGAKGFAVDRAIEHAWRSEPVAAQGSQKGLGAPASVRRKSGQPFAFFTPSAQRRHVGSDPGFIDKHEAARIKVAL